MAKEAVIKMQNFKQRCDVHIHNRSDQWKNSRTGTRQVLILELPIYWLSEKVCVCAYLPRNDVLYRLRLFELLTETVQPVLDANSSLMIALVRVFPVCCKN